MLQRNISTVEETSITTSEVNNCLDRIIASRNFNKIISITPLVYGTSIVYVIDYETKKD